MIKSTGLILCLYALLAFPLSGQLANYNFHELTYRALHKIDQANFDDALSLIGELEESLDSNRGSHKAAEIDFLNAYYHLFLDGNAESFNLLTKAGNTYDLLGMEEHKILCEVYLVVNLYIRARYKEAKETGHKLLTEVPQEQEEARAILHNILGAAYSGADLHLENAMHHNQSALKYYRKSQNLRRLTSIYGVLAAVQIGLENPTKAQLYIDSALYCAVELENPRQVAFLQIRKFKALFDMGKAEQAFPFLAEAEKYFETNRTQQGQLSWIYGMYAHSYAELENYKKAHEYLLKNTKLSNELRVKENDQDINENMVEYETEKKERQLEIQSLELKLSQQKTRNITIISLLSFLAILSSFFLYYTNFKKNQKEILQQKELEHQESILKQTISAQENERKRISQDLHDGIGQKITGLIYGLERIQASQDTGELTSQLATLKETSQEVRSLSHQMMPRVLETLGVDLAVNDLLESSFGNSEQLELSGPSAKNRISYSFENNIKNERFDPPIEIGVYRILQELISNVLKHSDASQVDVQIMNQKNRLIVLFEENGKGYDLSAQNNSSHGLHNLKTRAKIIGAKFQTEKYDGGMFNSLSIPLAANE